MNPPLPDGDTSPKMVPSLTLRSTPEGRANGLLPGVQGPGQHWRPKGPLLAQPGAQLPTPQPSPSPAAPLIFLRVRLPPLPGSSSPEPVLGPGTGLPLPLASETTSGASG